MDLFIHFLHSERSRVLTEYYWPDNSPHFKSSAFPNTQASPSLMQENVLLGNPGPPILVGLYQPRLVIGQELGKSR
jgi:hypothetical protein